MAKMGCGRAAVEALRAVGVEKIFGLMGSSTLEMYDALYDAKDMEYVGVRHENCGMHMADAYGRVTQTPGVFVCGQAGPGSANMVLGLAAAKMAYSPVVVITGLPATEHLGKDTFQEIDQHTLFLPVTKRVMTVPRSDRIPEFILEAFRIADSGRRGPVVINIPRDLFNHEIEVNIPAPGTVKAARAGAVDAATIEEAKAMILAARAPVIHAGAGVKWGRGTQSLIKLAEKLQLPVTTSAGHNDLMPYDHPLYLGGMGPRGNRVASSVMAGADVVIALGTRLGFNTTRYRYEHIAQDAKIVQIDIDATAVGRYFPVTLGVVGDAAQFAEGLATAATAVTPDKAPWKDRNEKARKDYQELLREREATAARTSKPLHPDVIYSELRKVAPTDAIFTLDAGTTGLQATDKLPYRTTPSLLTPLDCGSIGFSYAAGLGAKVADRRRTVITLMGDGGFGMTLGEVTTAVQHNINTIAVVMDNGTWGSEIAYQRDFYDRRYIGAHVVSPRYDEVMKLTGGVGYYVTEAGGTADAVREAMKADRPAVIHVKVDPEAVISFRTDALRKRA
jgi:acetolactate synthase-1/2/3 large subunit/sulfoacetaldehyde acetyltransferase